MNDQAFNRLVRIETRLARIQEALNIETRMSPDAMMQSEFFDDQTPERRLARIETRLVKLMKAMNINPNRREYGFLGGR